MKKLEKKEGDEIDFIDISKLHKRMTPAYDQEDSGSHIYLEITPFVTKLLKKYKKLLLPRWMNQFQLTHLKVTETMNLIE